MHASKQSDAVNLLAERSRSAADSFACCAGYGRWRRIYMQTLTTSWLLLCLNDIMKHGLKLYQQHACAASSGVVFRWLLGQHTRATY